MSINALTNAAVARRQDFAPIGRVPNGLSEIAAAAAGMPAAGTGAAAPADGTTAPNGVNTAMHVLSGYIPTEVLTLYVAVVAALHPGAGSASANASRQVQQGAEVMPADWAAFWIFLVATPVILWVVYASKLKSAEKPLPLAISAWPVWEMFAATVAYAAWAFALPGSPFHQYESTWYSASIAGVAVLVTSTALGLVAPLFQNKL